MGFLVSFRVVIGNIIPNTVTLCQKGWNRPGYGGRLCGFHF